MQALTIGPAHALVAGVIHALPTRATMVHVQQAGGTIEQSNDAFVSPGQVVTLDDDEQFTAAAAFIRAVTTDAIVTLKVA